MYKREFNMQLFCINTLWRQLKVTFKTTSKKVTFKIIPSCQSSKPLFSRLQDRRTFLQYHRTQQALQGT